MGCRDLWWLVSFYGEHSKMRKVQLALSCVHWGDLLETVNALRYLKGILLLYFLYQVYMLNLAEATIMKCCSG